MNWCLLYEHTHGIQLSCDTSGSTNGKWSFANPFCWIYLTIMNNLQTLQLYFMEKKVQKKAVDEKNPNWWVSVITLLPFQAGMGVGSSSTGRAGSLCAPRVLLCFYSDTIGFVCSWLCFARQNCWAELVRGEGILSEYLKSETLSDSGEIDSLKQCIACLLHGCFNEVGSLNKTQCLGPKSLHFVTAHKRCSNCGHI